MTASNGRVATWIQFGLSGRNLFLVLLSALLAPYAFGQTRNAASAQLTPENETGSPVEVLQLAGKLIQGGIVTGSLPLGYELIYEGQQLQTDPKGRFLLGLDRDHGDKLSLTLRSAAGKTTVHHFDVASRDYRIQRVEGIAKKIMQPSAADLKRIRAESAEVRQARAQVLSPAYYWQGFRWPIVGRVTGVYGSQRVYNGVPGRPHYGVDVAQPTGALVRAPAAGTVTLAHGNMFYSGGTLIIDHGHGLSSSFLHLSDILVEPGQHVEPGDEIAKVGATGRATGPHLDWRMNWRDARVDPQLLVAPMAEAIAAGKDSD